MTNLIMGREKEPNVILAYGVAGVGKSMFGAGAPSPIFLGPERNKELNVAKFPRTETHAQLMNYLLEIENGKHDKNNFRTVVLDSIDMHEQVIHADICKRETNKTMETACKGYGKAYKESAKMLYEVRNGLEAILNKKEMNLIVLGHSIKVDFNDPMIGTNYDRYEMCLHKGKKFDHNSIFVDWASTVLFMNWKIFATEDGNHAVAMGRREILTEYRPSHLAKNRFNLPYTIEMDHDNPLNTYNIVQGHIDQFYNSGAKPNTFQNDFNIIISECKELFVQVRDESLSPHIENAINELLNMPNIENAIVIKNRLNDIVSNQ